MGKCQLRSPSAGQVGVDPRKTNALRASRNDNQYSRTDKSNIKLPEIPTWRGITATASIAKNVFLRMYSVGSISLCYKCYDQDNKLWRRCGVTQDELSRTPKAQ